MCVQFPNFLYYVQIRRLIVAVHEDKILTSVAEPGRASQEAKAMDKLQGLQDQQGGSIYMTHF